MIRKRVTTIRTETTQSEVTSVHQVHCAFYLWKSKVKKLFLFALSRLFDSFFFHFSFFSTQTGLHRLNSALSRTKNMVFRQLIQYVFTLLEHSNVDWIYLAWLWALFKPLCLLLLVLFLLPATILIFMYGSSFFCLIYKHWNRLKVSWWASAQRRVFSNRIRRPIRKICGMEPLKP